MSKMTTIICSNYNSILWIDNYLDYLNKQTTDEFDVIFVDANSTDGSLEVIQNYNFRKGITKKLFKSNSRISIYEAWNIGILNSETPYVMNYNTDDKLYPAAIGINEIYALKNPNVDVFYSPCLVSSDKDHTSFITVYFWHDYSHELLLKNCLMGPYPYLKKQTIIEDGLFNPKFTISGDYEMWMRMSKKGRSFKKVPEIFGCYFLNPVGMSSSNDQGRLQEHIRQDKEIRNLYS